jgi:PepSY-associated TM region
MTKLVGRIIVLHRCLGIVFCLFFATWFATGIVMIYARMPELTEADRLAHLEPLDLTQAGVTPDAAFASTATKDSLLRATFSMVRGRPAYHFLPSSGNWVTVFADDGSRLENVDAASAARIAGDFELPARSHIRWLQELVDVDQWTVYPASRPYLPFQRVAADDRHGTEYYVSEATGSIFLRTTRRSRLLAWCGAIPHWWYIRALRANTPLWRSVMIVASGWGIVTCLAGLLTGILRFSPSRRYRFPGPKYSFIPYVGWKRWHNILGGVFGLFTFTWILSSLFTVNPGYWSPGPDPTQADIEAFAGGPLDLRSFSVGPAQLGRVLGKCIQPVELEMILFQGKPYYLARNRQSQVQLASASGDSEDCLSIVPTQDLLQAGQRVVGKAPLIDEALLTSFDTYYYTDLTFRRPLPVLRIRFADAAKTWLYVNPRTARIEASYKERTRLERWLYEGLHDLDFPFLYRHRPAWDGTVITLVAGGFALSVTGVFMGQRYVRKTVKGWR